MDKKKKNFNFTSVDLREEPCQHIVWQKWACKIQYESWKRCWLISLWCVVLVNEGVVGHLKAKTASVRVSALCVGHNWLFAARINIRTMVLQACYVSKLMPPLLFTTFPRPVRRTGRVTLLWPPLQMIRICSLQCKGTSTSHAVMRERRVDKVP